MIIMMKKNIDDIRRLFDVLKPKKLMMVLMAEEITIWIYKQRR